MVFDGILKPAAAPAIKIAALAAVTSSAEQSLGSNRIFAINATQDITIKFGVTGMGAATAADFRVPASQTQVYDTGFEFTHIRVFNLHASSTADVYIQFLSKF